jgi:hypothetical protein
VQLARSGRNSSLRISKFQLLQSENLHKFVSNFAKLPHKRMQLSTEDLIISTSAVVSLCKDTYISKADIFCNGPDELPAVLTSIVGTLKRLPQMMEGMLGFYRFVVI